MLIHILYLINYFAKYYHHGGRAQKIIGKPDTVCYC